jgi:outer membrane protein assembly factor BamA
MSDGWRSAANIRGWPGRGALLAALALLAAPALAQNADDPRWRIVVDGEEQSHITAVDAPAAARAAQAALAAEGYPLAEADSAAAHTLYLSRGPRLTVAAIEFEGMESVDAELQKSAFGTRAGRPLDPAVLEEDVRGLLGALDRAGRPLARAEVAAIEVGPDGLTVRIAVHEGPALRLAGLEFVPAGRTDAAFAARLAGLRPGGPLPRFDAPAVRRELEATGLFATVGVPELALDASGDAVIRVPVEEAQPGAVDLVLGYLPPAGPGDSGQLVGSGSLVLRNLFGRGRRMSLDLVRNPGLVSSLDIRAADPFLFGVPLRLEGRFSGYQQDSTFSRQLFGAELGYRFAPGLEAMLVASREYVESGIAGAVEVDGRPRVPGSDAWFGGVGLRFERVDRPMNPRRGLVLETLLEQGVKRRSLPSGSEEAVSVRQQRLHARGRLFIPTFARQAAVLGGDGAVLLGDVYDDSDLFRFGGATSLRGYEEEQFRGNVVARGLAEYRYQLDPTSHAFVFFDLGYIRRPDTPGAAADARLAPGYGLGLQYRTPLGLVTASYALNPEDGPTRGKVHMGLSIGL